jgi:hypothetical protein
MIALAYCGVAKPQERPPIAHKITTQELASWIDERLAAEYMRGGVAAPAIVDDATFLRRVFLDLQGAIPAVAQVRDFLDETGSFKRADYVDRLLNDDGVKHKFAMRTSENLAHVWRRMMVPASSPGAGMAVKLDPWLAKQFADNTPYDQIARKLLLAPRAAPPQPGRPPEAAPADPESLASIFEQAVGASPENLTSAYVRVFLGVRISCAQCHDHPFTDWKQKDFWGVAAFFAPTAAASGTVPNSTVPNSTVPNSTVPSITPAGDQQRTYVAKLLWEEQPLAELPLEKSPRQVFADWLISPQNHNFAATAVNRAWQYLCGRGLSGSVDDLDRVSLEERRMLDELARLFIESDFDMRWLVAGICKSKTYQQAAAMQSDTADGLARRPLKTLLPEQVFDSLEQALNLPVGKADQGPRHSGEREAFVARMNEAASESPADYKAGIPQALMLMNGKLTAEATSLENSRTLRAVVEAPFLSTQEKIETLYLAVLSRRPRQSEARYLLDHLERRVGEWDEKTAYSEILWGLINSPEFVLSK